MVVKNLILPTKGIVNKNEIIRLFVELIVYKTELRKTALRNRLRVARFILEGKIVGKDVKLYRENKVKFSHILILKPSENYSINIFDPEGADPLIHAERVFKIFESGGCWKM